MILKTVIVGPRAIGKTSFATQLRQWSQSQSLIFIDDIACTNDIETQLLQDPREIVKIISAENQEFILIVQELTHIPVYLHKYINQIVIMGPSSENELNRICKCIISSFSEHIDGLHDTVYDQNGLRRYVEYQFKINGNNQSLQALMFTLPSHELIHFISDKNNTDPLKESWKLNNTILSKRNIVDESDKKTITRKDNKTRKFWISWYTTKKEYYCVKTNSCEPFPSWLSGEADGR